MSLLARKMLTEYEQVSSCIYKFSKALGVTPNHHQRILFDAVMRAEAGVGMLHIAAKSGQGTGKTTGSVVVALFRTLRHVGAMTILTAPTMRQCKDVWLAEARRVLENADPFLKKRIEVTQTKIKIAGRPDWGVKTVTSNKEENAQGLHEKNMTIIMEEASGIPRKIVEQYKGTKTNPNALFLMIGNPNTRDCAFFDCFNSQRHMWECMTFNAEETQLSSWFDPQRNRDIAEEYGIDSDVYRIRVKGEFPFADPNCVISSEDLEKVLGIDGFEFMREMRDGKIIKQIGLDFARYGGDENVWVRRQGNAVIDWARYPHTEPARVIEKCFNLQRENEWRDGDTWYVADAGGMGQGTMHLFYDHNKQIMEFHNNGTAADSKEYENKITEAYFNLAKLVKKRKCALQMDPILARQLAGRQYFTNKKGRLVLETKDDYIKRGNDSPDRADGTVMAFYPHVVSSPQIARFAARKIA